MLKKINSFFDKIEDQTRRFLSKMPVFYAFIGGIGIVSFWRGVWGLSDDLGLTNGQSLIISLVILLLTGLFVSYFIGDQFIISNLRGEKKIIEKTQEEILNEEGDLAKINKKLEKMSEEIQKISRQLNI